MYPFSPPARRFTFVYERSLWIHQAGNCFQVLIVDTRILFHVVKMQMMCQVVELFLCQRLSEELAHFGNDALQVLRGEMSHYVSE